MPPFSACSEPRQRQVSWMSVGYKIQYRTQPIEFTVVRRERRTMQISVLPDSSVEVVAPCFCRRERYCDEDAQARWLDTQADAVLSAISAAYA